MRFLYVKGLLLLFTGSVSVLTADKGNRKYVKTNAVPPKSEPHEVIFATHHHPQLGSIGQHDASLSVSLNERSFSVPTSASSTSEAREQCMDMLKQYLLRFDVSIVREMSDGDFIITNGTISTWERIFFAKFYVFVDESGMYPPIHRARRFELSDEILPCVKAVLNVVVSYSAHFFEWQVSQLTLGDSKDNSARKHDALGEVNLFGTTAFVNSISRNVEEDINAKVLHDEFDVSTM